MIRNYLLIALRNLVKHRVFSLINVLGLAIGMAASLLIFQYVRYELSYDRFEPNAARIYRLQLDRYNNNKLSTQWAAGAIGIGPALKDALPDIESYARLRSLTGTMSYKNREFREENMFQSNEDFLPMFSYPALEGSITDALKEPNTAVLTASAAKKYFGAEDPLGKVLSLDKQENYKITAIVPDPPSNTHLHFNILLAIATMFRNEPPGSFYKWDWDGFLTYILVRPGTDRRQLEKKIAGAVQTRWGADMQPSHEGMIFHLQALPEIHLGSHFMLEAEVNGDGKSVRFLFIISIFIIVIAWINYTNLSTARAINRAREVGIRKTLGSFRGQLIGQFLFESLLVNALSAVLALLLILAFLPLFRMLTGNSIGLTLFTDAGLWSAVLILYFAGTLLSGLYPAMVLSAFRPISVLKGKLQTSGHGSALRRSLVIFQFAASVLLMIGTLCVYQQLRFMDKQDLGVRIDRMLVLKGPNVLDSTYQDKLNNFRTEVLRMPNIAAITASSDVPGQKVGWNAGGIRLVGADLTQSRQYRIIGIDYDFLDTYGLRLLKGRNFSRDYPRDSAAVLFNEAAVHQLGFTRIGDALNQRIEFWGKQYSIVGIVANHHQESLHQDYDAHIFRLIPNDNDYYSLRLTGNRHDWPAVIAALGTRWKIFFPGNPFDYFFLDDHYAEQYRADRQFGQSFAIFAVLAIFVSCLGLLGLAAFITGQRVKEISIRKVIGAGTGNILVLLTKGFAGPVLLSFLIAIPVSWWLLRQWLSNFAFRMHISPWMFILPAGLILLIALTTVSTVTLRAAAANPAKNLRTD